MNNKFVKGKFLVGNFFKKKDINDCIKEKWNQSEYKWQSNTGAQTYG